MQNRFRLCSSFSSALVALSVVSLQVPVARAQNTDDDVHIKPRVAPKPSNSDEIKDRALRRTSGR